MDKDTSGTFTHCNNIPTLWGSAGSGHKRHLQKNDTLQKNVRLRKKALLISSYISGSVADPQSQPV